MAPRTARPRIGARFQTSGGTFPLEDALILQLACEVKTRLLPWAARPVRQVLDTCSALWQGWVMSNNSPLSRETQGAAAPTSRLRMLASGGIVLGGALWGLYWLPVRYLGAAGLEGAWAGAAIYLAAVALLIPVMIWRARALLRNWRDLALCGLLTGAAFSFYSTSLLMTDVVRAILLFYLTPVWGTFLGVAFLNERLTSARVLALILAFGGLIAVVGPTGAMGRAPVLGDYLALASGIAWALGSFQLYRMNPAPVPDLVVAFAVGSLIVTGLTLLTGIDAPAPDYPLQLLTLTAPIAFAIALYVLPMLALTVWPATILSPGRIGLLLMSDAVVGIASAAAFAGEAFGWREALGTLLIVSAAAVEVLARSAPPAGAKPQMSSPDK